MDKESLNILSSAISKQIYSLFGNNSQFNFFARNATRLLLDNLDIFAIEERFVSDINKTEVFHINQIQDILSTLNEKELRRKKDGVYYTLPDVTDFITSNAFLKFINPNFDLVVKSSVSNETFSNLSSEKKERLILASVFDPTCGASEFLITAINIKLKLLPNKLDRSILNIASSIFGNDISQDSIYISKIRVFFALLPYITETNSIIELANIINSNFQVKDYINVDFSSFKSYDIIIGNPPYIEYRVLDFEPVEKLGNTYANVLSNAAKMLNKNGVIGFIVPLSLVATKRMSKIRKIIEKDFNNICLLNYADRPDCLFSGVHQKLTIILASKNSLSKTVYTSSYHYWYKQERKSLFDRCELSSVDFDINSCIPKIGNKIENSIFSKCVASEFDKDLYNSALKSKTNLTSSVYLNMRNCFWIKAFSFNPGSSEYKEFNYDIQYIDFIKCLLNSSLFFFFWIATSDCWHITSKELSMFKFPSEPIDNVLFSNLFNSLENKLESTKVYVGTKQTDYEYKHKLCKDEIDKIDDALAPIFNLTEEETNYIKNFILKYRLNDEA